MGLALNIGGCFSYLALVFYFSNKFTALSFGRPLSHHCFDGSDMSASAFIEALPVVEFVAQILGKDVRSRPLSDADSVKVNH